MDLIHQGEKDESSFFAGVFLTPEGQARQDQLRAKKGTTELDYDVFLSEAGRERKKKITEAHKENIFDGLFVRAQDSDRNGYDPYPNKKMEE